MGARRIQQAGRRALLRRGPASSLTLGQEGGNLRGILTCWEWGRRCWGWHMRNCAKAVTGARVACANPWAHVCRRAPSRTYTRETSPAE